MADPKHPTTMPESILPPGFSDKPSRTSPEITRIVRDVADVKAAADALDAAARVIPAKIWGKGNAVYEKFDAKYLGKTMSDDVRAIAPMDYIYNGGTALQESFSKLPAGAKKILVSLFDQNQDKKLDVTEFANAAATISIMHAVNPNKATSILLSNPGAVKAENYRFSVVSNQLFDGSKIPGDTPAVTHGGQGVSTNKPGRTQG